MSLDAQSPTKNQPLGCAGPSAMSLSHRAPSGRLMVSTPLRFASGV